MDLVTAGLSSWQLQAESHSWKVLTYGWLASRPCQLMCHLKHVCDLMTLGLSELKTLQALHLSERSCAGCGWGDGRLKFLPMKKDERGDVAAVKPASPASAYLKFVRSCWPHSRKCRGQLMQHDGIARIISNLPLAVGHILWMMLELDGIRNWFFCGKSLSADETRSSLHVTRIAEPCEGLSASC